MKEKILESYASKKSMKFLFELLKMGESFCYMSYRELGEKLDMSHENARKHCAALEKAGYIKIEKLSKRRQIFSLNMDKIKSLFE